MEAIERKYATRPVAYDLRCPACGGTWRATRPPNFWRWLKQYYRLTTDELRRCQRLEMFEIFDRAAQGELPGRAELGAAKERVIRYVDGELGRE